MTTKMDFVRTEWKKFHANLDNKMNVVPLMTHSINKLYTFCHLKYNGLNEL